MTAECTTYEGSRTTARLSSELRLFLDFREGERTRSSLDLERARGKGGEVEGARGKGLAQGTGTQGQGFAERWMRECSGLRSCGAVELRSCVEVGDAEQGWAACVSAMNKDPILQRSDEQRT